MKRKYIQPAIIICVVFTALYFGLRLFHLMQLQMFTDEAIYTRWSQIARFDPNWRFISLTDGKQPSFIWLTMITMRFFNEPLLAGRMVSVGAGFLSMIGMFFLGKEIFKSTKIGIVSSLLYIVYPMALVYDRMALYDGLVGMFTIWILYLEILLVRSPPPMTIPRMSAISSRTLLTRRISR